MDVHEYSMLQAENPCQTLSTSPTQENTSNDHTHSVDVGGVQAWTVQETTFLAFPIF